MTMDSFPRDERWIATRKFAVQDGGEVWVSIGVPKEDGNDFKCAFRISGLGYDAVQYAYGVDSMQALYIALILAGNTLYSSDAAKRGTLSWEGGDDLGLPASGGIADLLRKT